MAHYHVCINAPDPIVFCNRKFFVVWHNTLFVVFHCIEAKYHYCVVVQYLTCVVEPTIMCDVAQYLDCLVAKYLVCVVVQHLFKLGHLTMFVLWYHTNQSSQSPEKAWNWPHSLPGRDCSGKFGVSTISL